MRLIIVSNRLPLTAKREKNTLKVIPSIGGLATGLSAFLNYVTRVDNGDYLWVGVAETELAQSPFDLQLKQHHCHAIPNLHPLTKKVYQGFFNETIWPLFHCFINSAIYHEEQWQEYKKFNVKFCEEILNVIKPGDIVWVHDYQLMLLPGLLRKKLPELEIGFFLHIPFPPFEIFQFLPTHWREEILSGLLGADLIGFHIHEYQQCFSRCVLRILGYESQFGLISLNDRVVRVDSYPMGIDYEYISNISTNDHTLTQKNNFLDKLHGLKVILSIDRLDYTKGIDARLEAYEDFLNKNPQWRKKVVFVLIVAPSRQDMPLYQAMHQAIDQKVGCINGKFGDITWSPIIYQYKTFTQKQLVALYSLSDVALISPLRDGMNLTAKEYVAAKKDRKGVLILSETAGASKELLDAIIVNPYCTEEISAALKQALEMDENEKQARLGSMQAWLKRYDVIQWGHSFLNDLKAIKTKQPSLSVQLITSKTRQQINKQFQNAKKRLLLLDYDGTLVPFTKNPKSAPPNNKLKKLLTRLGNNLHNHVVIISGRDKNTLQQWLEDYPLTLIAEHGAWVNKNKQWQQIVHLNNTWKPLMKNSLEYFVNRLPGSFIEEKSYSIAWHYRNTDPEKRVQIINELFEHVAILVANLGITIMHGNKVVEIKSAGQGKDIAASYILNQMDYDFILAIGDDTTDEDMFRTLPHEAISIKVGLNPSLAKFNLRHHEDVLLFLEHLDEVQSANTA